MNLNLVSDAFEGGPNATPENSNYHDACSSALPGRDTTGGREPIGHHLPNRSESRVFGGRVAVDAIESTNRGSGCFADDAMAGRRH